MHRFARMVVLIASVSSGACTYHAADTPPGLSRGTVEHTTDYLKWAFERRSAAHVYNCLSEGLKERENLSLGDVDLFFEEIEGRVKKLLGDIGKIEIVAVEKRGPRTAWVTYRSGERTAMVRFVLETTYEIVPASDDDDGDFGVLPSLGEVMVFEEGKIVCRIPDNDLGLTPDAVHQVTILNAWLVDALDQKTVEAVRSVDP